MQIQIVAACIYHLQVYIYKQIIALKPPWSLQWIESISNHFGTLKTSFIGLLL